MANEDIAAINARFDRMEQLVIMNSKEVLTIKDVALLTGFTVGNLYRMTSEKKIPYYKPMNGKIFFKKTEIENWLLQNHISSNRDIESEAANYCLTHNK